MQPKWKFREVGRDEVNLDPIGGEFFTTNDVGDFADALVRETIQNSMDARIPNLESREKVKVRFCFSKPSGIKGMKLYSHEYFRGLRDHLYAQDSGLNLSELPATDEQVSFLSIEDFNTVGLDGEIDKTDDIGKTSPLGNNFYWFWRNVGRSGKTGSESGKWGLGKTVFPASSRINSFFGLTKRHDDSKMFLMGLSVLKTHHLESNKNVKRYPYGYFGVFEDNNSQYFATPVRTDSEIEEFCDCFQLSRLTNESAGLSIVIPFPRKEINSISVLASVLKQYFHPIVTGKLEVIIQDDESNIKFIVDNEHLGEALSFIEGNVNYKHLKSPLKHLFEFCSWSSKLSMSDFITLPKPAVNSAPQWKKEAYVDESVEKKINEIRDAFEEGTKVAFKIAVPVKQKEKDPEFGEFKVFLQRDELLKEPETHFVRGGITITGAKKPRIKYLRSLVVIEDETLMRLLGAAENPAHTEWQKDSSHFRGKYDSGDKVLAFVQNSISFLHGLLVKPAEGIERDLVNDLFYINNPDLDVSDRVPKGKSEGSESEVPEIEEKESLELPYYLRQIENGFELVNNPNMTDFQGIIEIKLAYNVLKGNPFQKYSIYDFDLQKMDAHTNGIINYSALRNTITIEVNNEAEYLLGLTGFDTNRDLIIKTKHNAA